MRRLRCKLGARLLRPWLVAEMQHWNRLASVHVTRERGGTDVNIHSIDTVYRFICGRCGYIREFGSMHSAEAFMQEHNRMHDTTTSGWSAQENVDGPSE